MKKVTLVRPERKTKVEYVKQSVVTLDEVLHLVNQLNPSQKKELLARMSLFNQILQNGESRDSDMWSGAIYDTLLASVGHLDGGMQGPAVIKRLLSTPNAFRPVKDFMDASKLSELKVTERQAVYSLLAKLVVANAKQVAKHHDLPISAKLVSNCATNVSGIFAQSFPGYLESGLVPMLAKSLLGPVNFVKD